MNITGRAVATATLLLSGLSAATATPKFTASETLTAPMNGAVYHATLYGSTAYAQPNTTSSNHFVSIIDEPANTPLNVQYDMYLTTTQGNSPDDFYSGPVQCDANGGYKHLAKNTGSLNIAYYYVAGSYTSSATSDFYNVNNTAQKDHNSSSASFMVVYP